MRIITNRLEANINYDVMLDQYTFFLISLVDAQKNHFSVYTSLEELLTNRSGCTVVAFDGGKRHKGDETSYRRLYVVACKNDSGIFKEDVVGCLTAKCDIEEADGYTLRKSVPTNQLLNVLLTLLPNSKQSVLYAHGKYLFGNCKDWNKNYNKRGELVFLHVFIDASCCLRSRVQTLTKESQFRNKKILRGATPYYLSFDEKGNIHISTKAQVLDDDRFYDFKPKGRDAQKNSLPFLCYKDIVDLKQCQAYVLNDLVRQMNEAYVFLNVEFACYTPTDVFLDKSAYNDVEDLYVEEFKRTHNIKTEVLDDDPATLKMSQKVNDLLTEIGIAVDACKEDALIRIVPSLDKDERLKKEERNKEKTRQSLSKLNYHKRGIPVQDVTVDHDDINKETVKNLIRQLAVKDYCLKFKLPQYVAQHFDGCNIVYGERLNGKFDIITFCLDAEDIAISYDSAADDGNEPYISSLGIFVDLKRIDKLGKRDSFFIIKRGNVTYQIINTEQFVLPEIDNMEEELMKRELTTIPSMEYESILDMLASETDAYMLCRQRIHEGKSVSIETFENDCSQFIKSNVEVKTLRKAVRERAGYTIVPNFKNKANIEFSLSAYTNITYWQQSESNGMHWCYSVGTKSQNFGTKTDFLHKTHVHHVFTDRPVSKEDVQSLIIDSLHDGWLRINEFSVEPSIFKFTAEALELHRTELYANGFEYIN